MSNDSTHGKVPNPEFRGSAVKPGSNGTFRTPPPLWIVGKPLLVAGSVFAAERLNPGHTGLHAVVAGLVGTALAVGWLRKSQRSSAAAAQERDRLILDAENSGKRAAWLDLSPVSVIVTDPAGCIRWVNPAFTQLTGFGPEEIQGRTPGSFLQGPGTDPEAVRRMREAIRAGRGFRCEVLNYTKSGRACWIQVDAVPLHGDGGTLEGFLSVQTDITVRHRLERDVELGRQKLAGLMAAVPGVVFEMFQQQDGTLGFGYFSGGLGELVGIRPESAIEDPSLFLNCVFPADRSSLENAIRDSSAGSTPLKRVFRVLHLSRGVRSVSCSAVPQRLEDGGCRWTGMLVDVTAEVEREASLLRRQRDLDRLESLARFGSWRRCLRTGATDGSDELHRILGVETGLLRAGSDGFLDLIHPEDRARFQDVIHATEDVGQPFEIVFRVVLPSGGIRWIRSRGGREVDVDGLPLSLCGTVQDVTETVLQERELATSELRWRAALESAGDVVWEWDIPSGAVAYSGRWHDLFQVPGSVGLHNWEQWLERIHPEDRPGLEAALEDLRTGFAGCLTAEYRVRGGDGRWIWVRDCGTVLARDGAGGPVQVVGSLTDITARKAMESTLASQVRLLEEIQGLGRIGFWSQGSDPRHVVLSPVAKGLLGGDAVAANWSVRLGWMDPAEREAVEAVMGGNAGAVSYVVEYRAGTGPDAPWIRESAHRIADPDNGGFRVEGWLQDVSALHAAASSRRELEERLRHAQRMEMIGTLAGGIAHDFNNLLTGIRGFVDLAKLTLTGNPDAKGYLDHALSGADEARDLVRRLLAFARQAPRALEGVTDIAQMVRQVAPLLTATFPAQVALQVRTADGPCPVAGDPAELQQALMNLCLEAGLSHGDSAAAVEVSVERDGVSHVVLRVSDSGPVSDPAERRRLFEPFRLGAFTASDSLGVPVSRGIFLAVGGEASVETAEGGGCAFVVRLPMLALPAADSVPTDSRVSQVSFLRPGAALRVAVVDDEPTVRILLRATLQKAGHSVEVHGDAQSLLDALKSGRPAPDLLVTDLAMPGMSGVELVERLRSDGLKIPVVGMSGDANRFNTTRLAVLGPYATLNKPFTVPELQTALDAALGSCAGGASDAGSPVSVVAA
jgi:PAS domain S-box-containing protein